MILFGDRYSSDRLYFMCRIILMLATALFISLVGNVAMMPNPPKYRYIPVSTAGVILPQVPVGQANHDDKFVVDWTIDAVTRLYSFDFLNYREQLQDAQRNLTAVGWDNFQTAMAKSNNFNAILGNRFVLTAVPTGAGKVTSTSTIDGNFAWTVEFPMLISYRTSTVDPSTRKAEAKTITDSLNMSITVTRVGVFLNHNGLGIRAIVGTR